MNNKTKKMPCPDCDGRGYVDNSKTQECNNCMGEGYLMISNKEEAEKERKRKAINEAYKRIRKR